MKLNTLLLRLGFAVCLLSLCATPPVLADDDHEDTPLAKSMEQTSDAIKSLRKIDPDDWKAGAEAARTAADGVRKGMEFIPVLVKDMKDGMEKTKQIADYRRLMGLSYALLCELELAYLEEDSDKVDEVLKKVKANKKEGHKKYSDD
jgi:hypothetical protein